MARKNAHAVALGRRGGKAGTEAQHAARALNARKGGRPPSYRLTRTGELERRVGDRWLLLEPPYDPAAKAFLRRR